MSDTERKTVYVNDNPIGQTEVYHLDRAHTSHVRDYRRDYTKEMTVEEAVDNGLRPCKRCFPVSSGESCPACGFEGYHDLTQEGFEEWRCGNEDCRVEVYRVEQSETTGQQSTETDQEAHTDD